MVICDQVSKTPGKNVIAGVNVFTGVNDTGDKLFASVNDTTDKVFHRQPLKLATAAKIVIGTAMKRHKSTSHILIRGPRGRQNYFKPERHYLVLAASGACDQDVWGVHGCNFSWRFQ